MKLKEIKDGLRRFKGEIDKERVKGSSKCTKKVCKASCKYLDYTSDATSVWGIKNICRLPKSIGFINKINNENT